MEENCNICGKINSVFSFKKVNKIHLVKCTNCKIIRIRKGSLSNKKISKYYDKHYFNNLSTRGYVNYHDSEKAHTKNSKKLLGLFKNKLKNKNILDYGCSYGFLLNEAKKYSNKICGVEHSSYARQIASQKKIKVYSNEKFLIKEKKKFDFIFIIGTIEHLLDPEKVLRIFNKILKKKGILIITTIDTKGFFPLYKLKPPEHTFYFNHNNLKILLNKCRFEILSNRTYFCHYFIHDLFSRLGFFYNSKILKYFSSLIKKIFPNSTIYIPTNEMCTIARKVR